MYWDTLTATGLLASLVSALGALYLVLRDRPVARGHTPPESAPGRPGLRNAW